MIGLKNKVEETNFFIYTTMLEHFITTPPRGYEHVVDKKPLLRSKSKGLLKFEQVILVQFTRIT